MWLPGVVLILAIHRVVVADDGQTAAGHTSEEQLPPVDDEPATQQPLQDEESKTTSESTATFQEFKKDFITYADAEKLAETGHHFLLAVVAEYGNFSLEYLKSLPNINKELARLNETLKIYPIDVRDGNNSKLSEQRIKLVPTVILFLGDMNGIIYNDDRIEPPRILEFYQSSLAIRIHKIETSQDLSAFDLSAYATVLFVINDENEETRDILVMARRFSDVKFGYVIKGSDIAKDFPSYLYVYRKGEERIPMDKKKSWNEIEGFVGTQTHQPIFYFPLDAYLISSFVEYTYVFYAHNVEGLSQNSGWLQNIGNKQRGKFLVLLCNVDDPQMNIAMDFLALKPDGIPYVRLFVKPTQKLYRMEDGYQGEINEESVTAFLSAFEKAKLEPYVKTQDQPEDWNASPLKSLVGSNYDKVVRDDAINVLVVLYNAEKSDIVPLFERLAELYKDFDNILIAKMDLEHNALPAHFQPVMNVPSIRLYEEHTNVERVYESEDVTEDGIIAFIKQTTGIDLQREGTSTDAAVETDPLITEIEPEKHEEL
ncbi:Thioredoxin [Trichostrongylus colubriformis]|uniref:Thioredoxin n=1 Tax=Trichostrongylus colubriformis TaxID=6319 RepID=A0AAN8IE27_TRICO